MAWGMSKKRAAQLCGGVFAILSLVLLFTPHFVFIVFDLESALSAEIIARRAGILFAGLAYLTLSTSSHPQNATNDRNDTAVILLLVGLAILGAVEWMQSRIGIGVWIAIGIEVLLAGVLVMAKAAPQTEGQGQ
ncbi:hypothetical protein BKI51_07085 [Alphaproteobacteria bacterium AO1-B]|nr:hypothetical protein BKI51_07085 [Alphaproteobacteria bacterium AO1-B]